MHLNITFFFKAGEIMLPWKTSSINLPELLAKRAVVIVKVKLNGALREEGGI